MRLIHTVPSVSEEASGPSYSVIRLCEALIGCGEGLTLAALRMAEIPSPPPFLKLFPLGFGPAKLGPSPAMSRWLDDMAATGQVSLLHNHSLWMMPNVYPGRVAAKRGVPLVTSPRGTLSAWAMSSGSPVKRIFWPLVQRPSLRATSCFHATSEPELADIRRVGFQQPVALIPNGVHLPAVQKPVSSDGRTLLFLGRMHPIKGLDALLPAWRAVQQRFPDWRLRIVGPGDPAYVRSIQRLATTLGAERVEFAGPLRGEAKWRAYAEADLYVLPSYSENFGMTVAEALASGKPAIVARGAPWGGLPREGAGWWIENGVDSLVGALGEALASSPGDLEAMGNRGRSWMEREFAWPEIGRKMANTYRWILDGGEKPPWVF
jgi:glycosyltransferase involved in cell wall biosynthesis